MSIFAKDVADLLSWIGKAESTDERPLGDRLRGRFADVDIDSVAAVREIREE